MIKAYNSSSLAIFVQISALEPSNCLESKVSFLDSFPVSLVSYLKYSATTCDGTHTLWVFASFTTRDKTISVHRTWRFGWMRVNLSARDITAQRSAGWSIVAAAVTVWHHYDVSSTQVPTLRGERWDQLTSFPGLIRADNHSDKISLLSITCERKLFLIYRWWIKRKIYDCNKFYPDWWLFPHCSELSKYDGKL